MGLIYWLLNLLIPLLLLTYTSILAFKQSNIISYGKWTLMIVIIYLMGWLSWILDDSYIVFFIDLTIKLTIPFVPQNFITFIEQLISNLHLQRWLNKLRHYIIDFISQLYIKSTDYLFSKMNEPQDKQFRSTLISHLNNGAKSHTQYSKTSYLKNNSNDETNKSSIKSVANYQSLYKGQNLYQFQKQLSQKIQGAQQLCSKQFISKQYELQQQDDNGFEQFPRFSYDRKKNQKQKKDVFENAYYQIPMQQNRSQYKNQDMGFRYERISQGRQLHKSQINKQVTQLYSPTSKYHSPYYQQQPSASSPYKQLGSQYQQHLESQYQRIFTNQPHYHQTKQRVLQSRVQVILQIGSGSSARLQIYNLELYSNRDLRIVSLYGREFQCHKLHSMRALPHGYYELIFEGGKILSRKCKFRQGNFQSFLKYLN